MPSEPVKLQGVITSTSTDMAYSPAREIITIRADDGRVFVTWAESGPYNAPTGWNRGDRVEAEVSAGVLKPSAVKFPYAEPPAKMRKE